MLNKHLIRKQSYEKIKAEEINGVPMNIRGSVNEPIFANKNKNMDILVNLSANRQRINAIGGHGVQKQI